MQQISFLIKNPDEINKRIDKLLFDKKPKEISISRNKIKDLILKNHLKKNGEIFKNPSYKTNQGEKFTLSVPLQKLKIEAQKIPLNIIYEDDDMLVINKQAGLISHIGAGKFKDTLVNALLYHYGKENLSNINGEERLGIVHRLDKDTSGLMVVAKNNKAHESLAEQIKNKTLKRNYLAFVWGVPNPKKGKIEGYIGRNKKNRLKMQMYQNANEGKYSLTNYEVKKIYGNNLFSLIECKLDTGRTHQIRVHLAHKKYPLIGDRVYGGYSRKIPHNLKLDEKTKKFIEYFPRQALHSYKINFLQPTTNKLKDFEINYPKDLKQLVENLEKI
jgi:23S rRNA pseudouridine1911/1915/1917 synthase